MSEQDILDGVGNEVVYFFGKTCIEKFVSHPANISLRFSVPGLGPGDSDSLVLHLRGGARGAVRHPGGEEPHVRHQLRPGDRDHIEHSGGGEAGRHPVPAAAAA